MKIKFIKIGSSVVVAIFFILIAFGSGVDINDENAVIEDMQGTWGGNDHEGGVYTHYKLIISGTNFKGWMKSTYTDAEPDWSSQPDETGTFTLSPVQGYTNATGNYRNINFSMIGGGYGNNSLTARAFTNMIIYDESSGLYVAGWGRMSKK